jgi:hypothetical protein
MNLQRSPLRPDLLHILQLPTQIIRQRQARIHIRHHLPPKQHLPIPPRLKLRTPEHLDPLLHLRTEMPHETLDGPCGGVAEGADGAALDLLGDLEQHVDLTDVGPAGLEAVHHVHHPGRALTTGRALVAGLVLVELQRHGE